MHEYHWKTGSKRALCTRVSPLLDKSVRRLTKALGITISEYLRRLIFQDLDARKLFDDELRQAVHSYNDDDVKPRRKDDLIIGSIRSQLKQLDATNQRSE